MTEEKNELRELQEKVASKQRIENQIQYLENLRWELVDKVQRLEAEKEKEQLDVEHLEGRSLTRFILQMTGSLERRMDQEQREACAAMAKYEAAKRELEELDKDLADRRRDLQKVRWSEVEYQNLLKEKADKIANANTVDAGKIIQLEEQITLFDSQMKEIDEAIQAGSAAKSIADQIISELGDAESWGTWDAIGGGLISNIAKHDHLDRAQDMVENLQVNLRKFKTELADVEKVNGELTVNCDSFTKFADFFFDGLFVDLMVLDKIRNSQSQVCETRDQIQRVMSNLEKYRKQLENQGLDLREQREKLIVETEV